MTEQFESRSVRLRRWVLAFAAGLMLHAGVILAALAPTHEQDADDDLAGPIAIELAPLPVSPPSEKLDLPLGPRAEETPASTPTPTKSEVAKEEEAPNLTKTPYEPDDPDLRFAKQNIKKDVEDAPQEDKTTEEVETAALPSATPVPETTAPQPVDAAPAPVAAAPRAGLSDSDKLTIERWQRKLVVHLNKFKRYPAAARERRIEGDVVVTFAIDRQGRVTTRSIAHTSGASMLDEAALSILERSGLLPPPPSQIAGATVELTLPIEYRVKN